MTATTATPTTTTTQLFRVYIKTTPQKVWDAITTPEWSARYGYGGEVHYDMHPGGDFYFTAGDDMRKAAKEQGYDVPERILDGEVIEADPPRRLVQTWRLLMEPSLAAEHRTKLTYELDEVQPGVTRLTVVHDLEGAPRHLYMVTGAGEAEGAGGGWMWVLSSLKTLLETGSPLEG